MKKQRIVGRPPRWPLSHEAAYRADLKKLVAALDAAARVALARHGQALLDAGRVRGDQDEEEEQGDYGAVLDLLLFEISSAVGGALLLLLLVLGLHARATAEFHKRDFANILRRSYGVSPMLPPEAWLTSVLRAWTDANGATVRAMPEQYTSRLRSEFAQAVIEGRNLSDLRSVVADTTEIARRRSALTARTQLGNLMAQLSERRQRALGVTSYRWITMLDERVRPAHRVRHGKEYRWSDPGIKPGSEINCRCVSAPILPGLTVEQLGVTVR